MADTLILAPRWPTGATLYLQLAAGITVLDATAAPKAFVAFATANWARYAVAVPESPSGSGRYYLDFLAFAGANPAIVAGDYTWSIFLQTGGGPASSDVCIASGSGHWDGATFGSAGGDLTPVQASLAAITSTLDGYAALNPAAVVNDTVPTAASFVMALADSSPVPSTFVWRGGLVAFNGTGLLAGGKYPVSTYSKLTGTTARLTFSPVLPTTPANGDAFLLI